VSYDQLFKLILIGDSGVGKKTLRDRIGFELDDDDVKVPSNVVRYGKDIELNNVGICRIHVWEIEGNKKSRSIMPVCLKGANGVIFLFDITKVKTLTLLNEWWDVLRGEDPDLPIMLVGNKSDLQDKRALGRLDSFEYAHDRFCNAYIEICSTTGKKVEIMFHMMTQIMWDYYEHKNNKKS